MKIMKAVAVTFSLIALPFVAQAEGVSQEDIERGNNPSSTQVITVAIDR